jgi:hypothetical protein
MLEYCADLNFYGQSIMTNHDMHRAITVAWDFTSVK